MVARRAFGRLAGTAFWRVRQPQRPFFGGFGSINCELLSTTLICSNHELKADLVAHEVDEQSSIVRIDNFKLCRLLWDMQFVSWQAPQLGGPGAAVCPTFGGFHVLKL